MMGEIISKAVTETIKETGMEVGKTLGTQSVDITKRIDVKEKPIETKSTGVDITKRIEPEGHSDLKETAKEYIDDLKSKSEFPDLIKDSIDVSKLDKITPEENTKMREEFDNKKVQLRNEWGQINHQEWPRYTEPVYNDKGIMVRKPGDCYDAHHIQPLELGGKNDASNITPLDLNSHIDIHSKNGSCTKFVDRVKEWNNE